jgi:putative ABC transport system permease protein
MIRSLAWQQLTFGKMRLLAAVAGITFAVVLEMQQLAFRDALYTSATYVHDRLRGDLIVTSPEYEYLVAPGTFPRRRLYELQRLEVVESVAGVFVGLLPFKDPVTRQDHQALLIGFNPDDGIFEPGSLPGDFRQMKAQDTILLDARSRRQFQPFVDRIRKEQVVVTEVAGQRIDFTGLFELGAAFTGQAFMMASDDTFRHLLGHPESRVEIGLVRLKPGSDVERVRAALATDLPPDVKVMNRREFADMEIDYWSRNSPIGFIFGLGVFVGLAVGAVIVYQILFADVTDHLPQYATLKAMGYTDRALAMVVMQEAVILSTLGFPIGLLISQVLYLIGRQATALPLVMTVPRAALVFVLTLAMCVASGMLALRKLRSADPADAF